MQVELLWYLCPCILCVFPNRRKVNELTDEPVDEKEKQNKGERKITRQPNFTLKLDSLKQQN